MTETEALQQIAALCAMWSGDADLAARIEAILARVGSVAVPPDGWFPFGSHVDFDGPLEFSPELDEGGLPFWERHVGSGAVPPHDIDRDALLDLLVSRYALWLDHREEHEGIADEILALVRPVEGVTLTPQEVGLVRWLLHFWGIDDDEARIAAPPTREQIHAFAARLGASS